LSFRPAFENKSSFVYDVGRIYSEYQHLTYDNILGLNFALSSGTEIVRLTSQLGDGTSRFSVFDMKSYISNSTSLTLLYEADDTDFTRLYQWVPPFDVLVDRIEWNVGLALNVSAASAGNFRITSVDANLNSYKAQNQVAGRRPLHYAFSMTNMTTTGDNQIAILNTSTQLGPFPVYSGGILEIDFDINTVLGTGTYQKGIMATFPYQNTGGDRVYSVSGFKIYYRPNPDIGGSVYAPTSYATYGAGIG